MGRPGSPSIFEVDENRARRAFEHDRRVPGHPSDDHGRFPVTDRDVADRDLGRRVDPPGRVLRFSDCVEYVRSIEPDVDGVFDVGVGDCEPEPPHAAAVGVQRFATLSPLGDVPEQTIQIMLASVAPGGDNSSRAQFDVDAIVTQVVGDVETLAISPHHTDLRTVYGSPRDRFCFCETDVRRGRLAEPDGDTRRGRLRARRAPVLSSRTDRVAGTTRGERRGGKRHHHDPHHHRCHSRADFFGAGSNIDCIGVSHTDV